MARAALGAAGSSVACCDDDSGLSAVGAIVLLSIWTVIVMVLSGMYPGKPDDGLFHGDCYPNKTCNEGLVCSGKNICEEPPVCQ